MAEVGVHMEFIFPHKAHQEFIYKWNNSQEDQLNTSIGSWSKSTRMMTI